MPAFREAEIKATKAAREVNPNQFMGGIFFDPTKPGPASDAYFRVLNKESKNNTEKLTRIFGYGYWRRWG